MAWFKVDDGWWSHPKTLQLSDSAVALWTRSGSWACQHLTDGFVPTSAIRTLGGTPKVAAELVAVGYWEVTEGGWLFHDWVEYQEASEVVKKRRGDARERMRVVRANRTRTGTSGSQEVRSTPTRPDPTLNSSTKSTGSAKRGSRISPSFQITDTMRGWAAIEVPLVNVDKCLPEFIDYWKSVAGEKGVKLDWEATWHNGMRKQQEFAERDAIPRIAPRGRSIEELQARRDEVMGRG